MAFFIGIACPWLLVAVFLLMMQRRAEDPDAGQWRSEPSTFFGGPIDDAETSRTTTAIPPAATAKPALAAGTVH